MALINHVATGRGRPPMVFVHGFGCAHGDWNLQVAHFSPRLQTVAVDLPGHGDSAGTAESCSILQYGAAVTAVMRALDLPPAVLVGHSMGCRVVTEAALQAPNQTAGVVLVDGSQFAPAMEAVLRRRFATPEGYGRLVAGMFEDMFTGKSDRTLAASIVARAGRLRRPVGAKMLTDLQRYDVGRFADALAEIRVPVLAIQSTYSNERRERRTMTEGQATPFLEMVRARVAAVRIEIIPGTGHFPQLDEAARTNELIGSFIQTIPVA